MGNNTGKPKHLIESMKLKRTAFFDTKPHDKGSFERQNNRRYDIRYFETRQNKTLSLFVSLPNIITNSHRAFLTHEALANIVAPTAAAIN